MASLASKNALRFHVDFLELLVHAVQCQTSRGYMGYQVTRVFVLPVDRQL